MDQDRKGRAIRYFPAILAISISLLVAGGNVSGQATKPATSKPSPLPLATVLRDANESVADYARRAGIKDGQIELKLDANVLLKLTLIPAGKFMMGSPISEPNRNADEGPQHAVTLTRAFYMSTCEVTQEQYRAVMGNNPSLVKNATNPVECVSWGDAVAFCKKASAKTGMRIQLPMEAQWEYACRAGTTTAFNTGTAILPEQANCDPNSVPASSANPGLRKRPMPVGSFKPNGFGLFDMHGNAWEWCEDRYDKKYYATARNTDLAGPDSGDGCVLRGGSSGLAPWDCRCASRHVAPADYRYMDIGFRVVVPAEWILWEGKISPISFLGCEGGFACNIVFVADRSGSMSDLFATIQHQMKSAISKLAEMQEFHVILMGEGKSLLETKVGKLVPATEENKKIASAYIDSLSARGRTDPLPALMRAFDALDRASPKPGKVMFVVTDGAFPEMNKVEALIRSRNRNKDIVVHIILCSSGPNAQDAAALRKLATENNGQFIQPDMDKMDNE